MLGGEGGYFVFEGDDRELSCGFKWLFFDKRYLNKMCIYLSDTFFYISVWDCLFAPFGYFTDQARIHFIPDLFIVKSMP